jgi:serine/threonine protein kinase/tetratricopeptide (TPR) repeat protein
MPMRCPRCHTDNPEETRFCGRCGVPLPGATGPGLSSTVLMTSAPLSELIPGETFAGRYQVIEDLGKGGMGRVYKVYDTEVREKLALKLLNPEIASDERTIERFRGELRLARAISHRNVCRMHDLGREGETYFITMEYVPGEDLKSLIHRIGILPVGKAVSIARQVCEGLEEAHRVGVIHRDLKPQNIMIDRDGNARIMDFGIARSVKGKGITGTNVLIGTPEYMSPEQVEGKEAGPRSDLYSLGIVLFEMLTGRLPFEGESLLSIAVKQKSEAPPDPRAFNAQVPEELARLVLRCLDKAPEKRPAGAVDLASGLAKIEDALPTTTTPLPLRRPATSKSITVRLPSKKVWIPALAGLVLAIAFAAWQFIPQRAADRRSIAVIGFRNQTGDPSFDYLQETIPNLLITSLEQSGHFRVTTWQQLRDLLRQDGKDAAAVLDEDAAFAVCRREGIEALAVGFYTKAGETFVTDVKVLDAATRQPLKTAQSRGDGPASILKTQIDEISRSISRGIGLPPLKIEKAQPRVADVTTSSLEAYKDFLSGRDQFERFFAEDARRSLERAVALDPSFAVAWLYLSRAYNELMDRPGRDKALEAAHRFSAQASEKERLYIEAEYASLIEKNGDKRFRLLTELTGKYPDEKYAHFELGRYYDAHELDAQAMASFERALALDPNFGYALNVLAYLYAKRADYPTAIRYYERYAAVNPGDPNPQDSIAELDMRMGRLDESAAKYEALLSAWPDFAMSWASLAYVRCLQEKYDEARRSLENFIAHSTSPSAKNEAMWVKAFEGYLVGRWDESLQTYLALKERAGQTGSGYLVAATDWIIGFVSTDQGEFDRARQAFGAFNAWHIKQNTSDPAFARLARSFTLAWVDLRQGRIEKAGAAVKEMEAVLPSVSPGMQAQATFMSQLLGAEVALAGGPVDEAIEAGRRIVFMPFTNMRTASMANYNLPFLKDVLARAYWKKGDLDKAAAEYRKLLTVDPANQVRYLMSPLYHYRLGRMLEEKGDRAGAHAEYAKFLDGWKDADPSHPELADARRRLAAR